MTDITLNQEVNEQKKQKRPFTPPQIVELGSALGLIQGGGSAGSEDGSGGPKPRPT